VSLTSQKFVNFYAPHLSNSMKSNSKFKLDLHHLYYW